LLEAAATGKKGQVAGHWHRCLTPVILATEEAEIRRQRSVVSQPEKIVQETLS
jgi:hypothetical protein